MEKVRPWCGQPSDRGRLKNEQNGKTGLAVNDRQETGIYADVTHDPVRRPLPTVCTLFAASNVFIDSLQLEISVAKPS